MKHRFVGIKSRGVYETPGGHLLREAHMDLEMITVDKEVGFAGLRGFVPKFHHSPLRSGS